MNGNSPARFQISNKRKTTTVSQALPSPKHDLADWIATNPIRSIGIAIVLGAVIGCLLKRR